MFYFFIRFMRHNKIFQLNDKYELAPRKLFESHWKTLGEDFSAFKKFFPHFENCQSFIHFRAFFFRRMIFPCQPSSSTISINNSSNKFLLIPTFARLTQLPIDFLFLIAGNCQKVGARLFAFDKKKTEQSAESNIKATKKINRRQCILMVRRYLKYSACLMHRNRISMPTFY